MCFVFSSAACYLSVFAYSGRYRSFAAVVTCVKPLQNARKAVPVVKNVVQARETILWAIPNSSDTLVSLQPSFNLPMILYSLEPSRCNLHYSCWTYHSVATSHIRLSINTAQYLSQKSWEQQGYDDFHRKSTLSPFITPILRHAPYMPTLYLVDLLFDLSVYSAFSYCCFANFFILSLIF